MKKILLLSSLFLFSIFVKPIFATSALSGLRDKCLDLLTAKELQKQSSTSELLQFLNNFLGGVISVDKLIITQNLSREEEFVSRALEETFAKIKSFFLNAPYSPQNISLFAEQVSIYILGRIQTPEYTHKLKIKIIHSLADFFDQFNPSLLKDRQQLSQAIMGLFSLLYWIKTKPQEDNDQISWTITKHEETLRNILSTPLDQHEKKLSSALEKIIYFRELVRKEIENKSIEIETEPKWPASIYASDNSDSTSYHTVEDEELNQKPEILSNSSESSETESLGYESIKSTNKTKDATTQTVSEKETQTDIEQKDSSTQTVSEISTQTEDQNPSSTEKKDSSVETRNILSPESKTTAELSTQTEEAYPPPVVTIERLVEQSRENDDSTKEVSAAKKDDTSQTTENTISTQTDSTDETQSLNPAEAKSKMLQKIKNLLKNPNMLKALLAAAAAGTLSYGGKKLYDAIKKHLDEQKKAKKIKKRKKAPPTTQVTKEQDAELDALDQNENNQSTQQPPLNSVSEKGARYLRLFLGVSFASNDSGNLNHLKSAELIYQQLGHSSATLLSEIIQKLSNPPYEQAEVQKMFREVAFEFEAGSSERVILNSIAQKINKLQIHTSKQEQQSATLAFN